jgi:deazaflavin-dependent oxidoreductase (nitroreductase family)
MSTTVIDATAKLGYLETTGRVSGQPRETEIWWALDGDHIFLLSGGGLDKDWVKNFLRTPRVRFRVRDAWVTGTASVVTDPALERRARVAIAAKYYGYDPARDDDLPNSWTRTATPVAIELDPAAGG